MQKNTQRAFTLIELLVVIAIIGILSSVILASLNAARAKGRDAQREETIHQIANALNLAAGATGFPTVSAHAACLGTSGSCWGGAVTGDATLNSLLQPYISSISADPSHSSGVGDRYVYLDPTNEVAEHCNGTQEIKGSFILWEPDTIGSNGPSSDSLCSGGYFACCASSLGCQLPGTMNYFCAKPLQ